MEYEQKSISFSPARNVPLKEQGITVYSMPNGAVINMPKPLEYCVPHGFRVGYWKFKNIKL